MNQFICEEEETTTVNIIGWFYHSSKVKFMKLNKFPIILWAFVFVFKTRLIYKSFNIPKV
jgi:hypothetical protein